MQGGTRLCEVNRSSLYALHTHTHTKYNIDECIEQPLNMLELDKKNYAV